MCLPGTGSVQQKPITPHPPSASIEVGLSENSKLSKSFLFDLITDTILLSVIFFEKYHQLTNI
jgi:hypothetical protein